MCTGSVSIARDIGRPPYPDIGRPLAVGEGVPRAAVGDARAGGAGGAEEIPSVFVKHRDQMLALTGIIIGLLGFAPGSNG